MDATQTPATEKRIITHHGYVTIDISQARGIQIWNYTNNQQLYYCWNGQAFSEIFVKSTRTKGIHFVGHPGRERFIQHLIEIIDKLYLVAEFKIYNSSASPGSIDLNMLNLLFPCLKNLTVTHMNIICPVYAMTKNYMQNLCLSYCNGLKSIIPGEELLYLYLCGMQDLSTIGPTFGTNIENINIISCPVLKTLGKFSSQIILDTINIINCNGLKDTILPSVHCLKLHDNYIFPKLTGIPSRIDLSCISIKPDTNIYNIIPDEVLNSTSNISPRTRPGYYGCFPDCHDFKMDLLYLYLQGRVYLYPYEKTNGWEEIYALTQETKHKKINKIISPAIQYKILMPLCLHLIKKKKVSQVPATPIKISNKLSLRESIIAGYFPDLSSHILAFMASGQSGAVDSFCNNILRQLLA